MDVQPEPEDATTLPFPGVGPGGLLARARRYAELFDRLNTGPALAPEDEARLQAEFEDVEASIRATVGGGPAGAEAVALPDGSILVLEDGILRFIAGARVYRAEAG